MGSFNGEEVNEWDAQDTSAQEEKIFVAVRLRPLNERELTRNDVPEWECINNTTVIFKNSFQERSIYPTAYNFDRVFRSDSPTRQVYEEAAKRIALSVLSGMNSTIFAYGQTSSGKTYTMTGITEYAVQDIFDYIDKHPERDFVLKFSAMEIYNEAVKDLLSTDGTPLRLLDDPERGTVVDKLTEVTLEDSSHLYELLSFCESQRQIGETALNEVSSRSHQILRLIVESEAREYFGAENSSTLTASVNFVDLAGSERASQTLSAGTRLKEGSHINRSLLTLGTVIRKLSKGRNAHIPYRDSKLTRILQNSLGGNAKTAVICTMSPAHSHLEQSRNTLLFASCAKNVSTNAQVNVVMSEKALVKQLQKELAKMENEMRNLSLVSVSSDSKSALKEKELLIQKMDKEIKDLTHQRDLAQSRLESLLRSGGESKSCMDKEIKDLTHQRDLALSRVNDVLRSGGESKSWVDMNNPEPRYEVVSNHSKIDDPFLENKEYQFLSGDTSTSSYIDKYFGPDPSRGWEKIGQENDKDFEDDCKEVQCIVDFTNGNTVSGSFSPPKGDEALVQSPCSSDEDGSDHRVNVSRSKSSAAILTTITKTPSSNEIEDASQDIEDSKEKVLDQEVEANSEDLCTKDSQSSVRSELMNDEIENINMVDEDSAAKQQEENCVVEINDVTKSTSDDNLELEDVKTSNNQEKTANTHIDKAQDTMQTGLDWQTEFERQKREIIVLWDSCNTPLVHRTYFFLLFKGDPSDAVYMEVELRRLSFLKNRLQGAIVVEDDQSFTHSSSAKALSREREMLAKRMLKRFSGKDMEVLYKNWGIDLKSKQRRVQLSRKLWTVTTDMEHIKESASIVAKLVGFKEPGQAPKEMFGLSFSPKPLNLRSFRWKN